MTNLILSFARIERLQQSGVGMRSTASSIRRTSSHVMARGSVASRYACGDSTLRVCGRMKYLSNIDN